MILARHEEAFRSLDPSQVQLVLGDMRRYHPRRVLPELSSGADLLAHCQGSRISQAEVVMALARDPSKEAEPVIEALIGGPIQKWTPPAPGDRAPRAVVAKMTSPAVRAAAADGRVVTLLVESNPKREGTSAHVRFGRYRTGMTVSEFIEAGGTMADVKWDLGRNFIRLDAPAE